jgi:hypothetical protein
MELRQGEVSFRAGSSVTVKAYGISYHRDHIAFTGWHNETVVAYRSDSVMTIRKVALT